MLTPKRKDQSYNMLPWYNNTLDNILTCCICRDESNTDYITSNTLDVIRDKSTCSKCGWTPSIHGVVPPNKRVRK